MATPSACAVFTLQNENRPSSVALVPSRQRSIRRRRCGHAQCQLGLGLERHLVGYPRLSSALRIVGPALRQIQLEVDRSVLRLGGNRQTDTDLAVRDLACRAGVLPLHAYGMSALFEKAGVVYHPRRHRLLLGQGIADMPCRFEPRRLVAPLAEPYEMQQLVMPVPRLLRIAARPRRDRLDALAFPPSATIPAASIAKDSRFLRSFSCRPTARCTAPGAPWRRYPVREPCPSAAAHRVPTKHEELRCPCRRARVHIECPRPVGAQPRCSTPLSPPFSTHRERLHRKRRVPEHQLV